MGIKDANKYLQGIDLGGEFSVKKFLKGMSNGNFIVCNNETKYVLRKRRRKKKSLYGKCFARESNVLRFFESVGLDFVPRSIFFNNRDGIHIVSYLEGKQIFVKKMSNKSLIQLAEKIYQINILAPEYLQFSRDKKVKIVRPRKIGKKVLQILTDEVNSLKGNKLFPDLAKWFRQEVKKDFSDCHVDESTMYLDHGDLTSNQVIHNGKISFIDWEFVKLSYDPGLAYIFFHSRLNKKKRDIILKAYARVSGIPLEKLSRDTMFWERMIILKDAFSACSKYKTKKDLLSPLADGDRMRIAKRVEDYNDLKDFYDYQ